MIQRPFRQYIYIALAMLAVTLFTSPPALAEGKVPPIIPNTYVQDHSNVLSADQEAQLQARLDGLKQSYDIEIGLATVPDFYGFADEQQLATAMAREYKIGSATSKYGLLILFKTNEKVRYFLAPSVHTQGVLPDGRLGLLARETIVPRLKRDANGNRDWAGGFNAALAGLEPLLVQLKAELNTQVAGATAPVADSGIGKGLALLLLIGIVIMIIAIIWFVRWLISDDSDYVSQYSNNVTGRTVRGDMSGRYRRKEYDYPDWIPATTSKSSYSRKTSNRSSDLSPSVSSGSSSSTYSSSTYSSSDSGSSFSDGGSYDGGGAGGGVD